METEVAGRCLNCGRKMVYTGGGFGRIYCSQACGKQYRRRRQKAEDEIRAEAEQEARRLKEEEARQLAEEKLEGDFKVGVPVALHCRFNRWVTCRSGKAEASGDCLRCGFNPDRQEARRQAARDRANGRQRR